MSAIALPVVVFKLLDQPYQDAHCNFLDNVGLIHGSGRPVRVEQRPHLEENTNPEGHGPVSLRKYSSSGDTQVAW